jgi:peptidyl serine alpha-galactosyltransferase
MRLFFAISAVGCLLLILSMQFLPPVDIQPHSHPLMNLATSKLDKEDGAIKNQPKHSSVQNFKAIDTLEKNDKVQYYMVFSTSCSKFQHWQAMAFFHFAKKVNQPGNVTRLVSGCTAEEAKELTIIHKERIAPLNPGFQMHITPDYNVHDNMKYWNKPHGLLDWMENVLGFPNRASEYNDAIIIIVDPDMMLLRPITHDFTNYKTTWAGQFRGNVVTHGLPIAQKYAYGSAWLTSLKGNVSYVVGPDSPIHNMTLNDASLYYPAGPPYLATGKDMYAIAKAWVKFLPRIHDIFTGFMAEMHAYSTAAAHLGLPHQLTPGFMISEVGGNENFDFLQPVQRSNSCSRTLKLKDTPLVLHYCHRYALGRWFFSKYKLREDFFTCDAPLLREPPPNVAEIYDWNTFPNGLEGTNFVRRNQLNHTIHHGWMLCSILFSLNEIAESLKRKHCNGKANFNKTWHFQDEALFQASLDDPTNPYLQNNLTDNPG